MKDIFTVKFLKDLAERVISTFGQAYAGAVVILPGDLLDMKALKIALGAAILSVFKGLAATKTGEEDTASLVA